MTPQKLCLLISSCITSQFNSCPLVWMIHNRKLSKKINKIHKRTIGIVYSDHKTSFSELLNIDKSVTIHQKNLQFLLSPTVTTEIFQFFESLVYELFMKTCL